MNESHRRGTEDIKMHRTRTPARGADSLVATNKQYAEYAAANLYDKCEHWAQRADKNGTREPDLEVGEGAVLSALCLSTHLKLSAN